MPGIEFVEEPTLTEKYTRMLTALRLQYGEGTAQGYVMGKERDLPRSMRVATMHQFRGRYIRGVNSRAARHRD